MTNLITVAQLAKILGVSKQSIYNHSSKIPKESQLKNQANQLVFNEEQVNMLKSSLSKESFKIDSKVETKEDYNRSIALLEEKENQIQSLKIALKQKDELIRTLSEQLSQSQRLVDQQQQLQLATYRHIEQSAQQKQLIKSSQTEVELEHEKTIIKAADNQASNQKTDSLDTTHLDENTDGEIRTSNSQLDLKSLMKHRRERRLRRLQKSTNHQSEESNRSYPLN